MPRQRILIKAILWPMVMTAIAILFVLPGFLHVIDLGKQQVDATHLSQNKKFTSKNVTVTGFPLIEHAVSLEKTNLRSRVTQYTYYVPVVSKNWEEGKTISCILQLDGKELDELALQVVKDPQSPVSFDAVVRNVLWETPDEEVLDAFKNRFSISADVVFIEYGSQRAYPLWLAGGVLLVSLLGSYKILTTPVLISVNKVVFSKDELQEGELCEEGGKVYVVYKKNKVQLDLKELKIARASAKLFCILEFIFADKTKIMLDGRKQENKDFFNQVLLKRNHPAINWDAPFPQIKTAQGQVINGYEILMD